MATEIRVIPHKAQHVVGFDYVDGWLEVQGCPATAGGVTVVRARPSSGEIDRAVALLEAEIAVLRQMLAKALAGGGR